LSTLVKTLEFPIEFTFSGEKYNGHHILLDEFYRTLKAYESVYTALVQKTYGTTAIDVKLYLNPVVEAGSIKSKSMAVVRFGKEAIKLLAKPETETVLKNVQTIGKWIFGLIAISYAGSTLAHLPPTINNYYLGDTATQAYFKSKEGIKEAEKLNQMFQGNQAESLSVSINGEPTAQASVYTAETAKEVQGALNTLKSPPAEEVTTKKYENALLQFSGFKVLSKSIKFWFVIEGIIREVDVEDANFLSQIDSRDISFTTNDAFTVNYEERITKKGNGVASVKYVITKVHYRSEIEQKSN
jgi:hypothetical protein